MPTKVLIVDDDKNICELLRLYLTKDGMETACAYDGLSAFHTAVEWEPNLILLDVMLPYLDGMTLCQQLRQQSDVPIIMLTAKGETDDKITGLTLGADDYVTKPFDPKEVVARIHAVLRRSEPPDPRQEDTLVVDNLTINLTRFELFIDGRKMEMPKKELELLYHLASHPERVYTREQLLDAVWGFDYIGDTRTVDVHIKRLRDKLDGVSQQWALRTVWGVGYKFEVMDANESKSV